MWRIFYVEEINCISVLLFSVVLDVLKEIFDFHQQKNELKFSFRI